MAGLEPATLRLEVSRAIHCATRTSQSSVFYNSFFTHQGRITPVQESNLDLKIKILVVFEIAARILYNTQCGA